MQQLTQVLLDLGDRSEAAVQIERARMLLTSLQDGAEVQMTRLDQFEQQVAGRPGAAMLAEPLTEREIAVLHLLRGTLSLRGIGYELHLSANTIKTHVQAIYRKLGVSTRRDAVERGHLVGLL